MSLAPLVFLLLLAGRLSIFTNALLEGVHDLTRTPLAHPRGQPVGWQDHDAMLTQSAPLLLVLLAVAFVLLSWVMARYVNINTFSLHGMYRDRIVRAYLGASNADRRTSRFTGFSNTDDVPMAALQTGLRPFHVVNLTLNLVAGSRLAWQQRKAASFTVTPLHCGSPELGYRPSSAYGGGISLGTAVAISGAAVLADANREDVFTQDTYVKAFQPLSVMVLPILSRNALVGVLYVEHRWLTGVFTAQRVEVLSLLASQAAISNENARLYSDLHNTRDDYRTLYESANEGLFRITADGVLMRANPTLARTFGFEGVTAFLEEYRDLLDRVFLRKERARELMTVLDDAGVRQCLRGRRRDA